ncbi:MAG: hypothetical protein LBU32_07500 [Clostridiales bacterium]|nr:hypothetical protein [Clostridiales bacterium]
MAEEIKMLTEQNRRADLPQYLIDLGERLNYDGDGNYILKSSEFTASVKNSF